MAKKIPTPNLPLSKIPNVGNVPKEEETTFSFRYWKQVVFFGLDEQSAGWFVGVLNRLRDISVLLLKAHHGEDFRAKNILHYHPVRWRAVNAPIQRTDLTWVPRSIIENTSEFDFYEFSISGAEGRIVGFWEGTVFNIVLLDPLHNIWPTKSMDRKPIHCDERGDKYTHLLETLMSFKDKVPCASTGNCLGLEMVGSVDVQSSVKAIYLKKDVFDELSKHMLDNNIPCLESYLVERVLGLSIPPSETQG